MFVFARKDEEGLDVFQHLCTLVLKTIADKDCIHLRLII